MGDVSPGSMGISEAPAIRSSEASVASNENINSFTKSIPAPPLTGATDGLRRANPPPPNVNELKSGDESSEQTHEKPIASQLHRAIDSCSRKDLYHGLVALQEPPEKIVPVLNKHTPTRTTNLRFFTLQAPPALADFLEREPHRSFI
jgi:hypothetical protein